MYSMQVRMVVQCCILTHMTATVREFDWNKGSVL